VWFAEGKVRAAAMRVGSMVRGGRERVDIEGVDEWYQSLQSSAKRQATSMN